MATRKGISQRPLLEIIAFATVLVLGLSVWSIGGSKKARLSYDGGQLVYRGEVTHNRMNGRGKLTYDNGDSYEGDFKNGVFEGQGHFISHQGWSYQGDFKNGQPDGQGKLIAKDKTVYKGQFKQGIYKK